MGKRSGQHLGSTSGDDIVKDSVVKDSIVRDNEQWYGVAQWGSGYFEVNEQGDLCVRAHNGSSNPKSLLEIVTDVRKRGLELPVILRFDDIILRQIERLHNAFGAAAERYGYDNRYRLAYPIKVNQQRHVVDAVRRAGERFEVALEVGSKPELLAVLAVHNVEGGLLLCNGYKDAEYIELALLGRRLGLRPIIIIEQFYELEMVLEASERLGVEAEVGVRMKPLSRGSGRWESSAGDQAKFGLSASQMMRLIHELAAKDKLSMVKLLHFHVGSQISSVIALKRVLREATRTYVELAKLCPGLSILDVGGGLAIDYDGSQTNSENSRDYTFDEYARDVVWSIKEACAAANIPVPEIISESGRATVAHHAVLIAAVTDVSSGRPEGEFPVIGESNHRLIRELHELVRDLCENNVLENFHDSLSLREELMTHFLQGNLSLEDRAHGEVLFRHLLIKAQQLLTDPRHVPEELGRLQALLRDLYFCNFSVFQSLPDSWAISQIFPVMPIHRLNEPATREGVIADLTCDSDGKIDKFSSPDGPCSALRLHPFSEQEPYYLGIFLVGAYQEILGDLHNLFGDTNAVHVSVSDSGEYEIEDIVEGDTIREVLSYVQFDGNELSTRFHSNVERALRRQLLSPEESADLRKRFRSGLEGYTYLVK